jgi:hypothetical protein
VRKALGMDAFTIISGAMDMPFGWIRLDPALGSCRHLTVVGYQFPLLNRLNQLNQNLILSLLPNKTKTRTHHKFLVGLMI